MLINVISIVKDIFPLAEKSAPLLASLLGGPSAGIVVSLLTSWLSKDPTIAQNAIQNLTTQSDAQLQLQKFEIEEKENLLKLHIQDREDARKFAETAEGKDKWIRPILMLINFILMIALFFWSFMVEDSTLKHMLMAAEGGAAVLMIKMVLLYFG